MHMNIYIKNELIKLINDHIRQKHSVKDSVMAANLGRWFPPWTVTRGACHEALRPQVSGVSTDVMLFR